MDDQRNHITREQNRLLAVAIIVGLISLATVFSLLSLSVNADELAISKTLTWTVIHTQERGFGTGLDIFV